MSSQSQQMILFPIVDENYEIWGDKRIINQLVNVRTRIMTNVSLKGFSLPAWGYVLGFCFQAPFEWVLLRLSANGLLFPGKPIDKAHAWHLLCKFYPVTLNHSFQRNPRADLLQNGLVGSPCSPRDSQESSPTPQFQSIHSSALSFLHSPTLTSIHDHWKNHSLD